MLLACRRQGGGAPPVTCSKSEVLWFGSASQLRGLRPDTMHITINQSTIQPVTVVRDLGVLFDGELSMRQQVSWLSQTCFYHLRRLRSVKSATRPWCHSQAGVGLCAVASWLLQRHPNRTSRLLRLVIWKLLIGLWLNLITDHWIIE